MESLSALLTLCEENLPVTMGFPSQRASNANLISKFNSFETDNFLTHLVGMAIIQNMIFV